RYRGSGVAKVGGNGNSLPAIRADGYYRLIQRGGSASDYCHCHLLCGETPGSGRADACTATCHECYASGCHRVSTSPGACQKVDTSRLSVLENGNRLEGSARRPPYLGRCEDEHEFPAPFLFAYPGEGLKLEAVGNDHPHCGDLKG